jgi:hypothetical protein
MKLAVRREERASSRGGGRLRESGNSNGCEHVIVVVNTYYV